MRIAREALGHDEILAVDVGHGEVRHIDLAGTPCGLRRDCGAVARWGARRLQRETKERELEAERLAAGRVEMAGDVPPLVTEARDAGRGRAETRRPAAR